MPLARTRRSLLVGLPLVVLVASAAGAAWMMRPPPADLDLSLGKTTEAGLYVATIAPLEEPIAIGALHAWIVTIEDAGGEPVEDALIRADGGMPQHGHGLPTAPAVTRKMGDGRYLLEGVRFNMDGWWELYLDIEGPAGADAVTYNLVL